MTEKQFFEELEQVFDNFPKYLMKILLGYFKAKVGRQNIFKPTIGNECLHQDNNDNVVIIVNFAISTNLVVKSTMFLHRNTHNHNQIDHILIDRRWHSSVPDVRSYRGAECDNDQYLVVAKLRERLEVSKQAAQNFDGERFNLKKLGDLEVRKQYQIEIRKRFAALKNLNDCDDTNRALENIKENIKTSAQESLGLQELKQHKPWFD